MSLQVWGVMHLTKNIIKIVARVVNNCYLLAERVRESVNGSTSKLYTPVIAKTWKIYNTIRDTTNAFINVERLQTRCQNTGIMWDALR